MADPNFGDRFDSGKFGKKVFGSLDGNAPGAQTVLAPGIGQQLGQAPGTALNQDAADLRQFQTKEYEVESISLVGARTNELLRFSRRYSFIWIPNSTNTTDILSIRIDSAGAGLIPFLPGMMLNGIPFENLYLTNSAIAGATMTLMVAENWPVDQLVTDS